MRDGQDVDWLFKGRNACAAFAPNYIGKGRGASIKGDIKVLFGYFLLLLQALPHLSKPLPSFVPPLRKQNCSKTKSEQFFFAGAGARAGSPVYQEARSINGGGFLRREDDGVMDQADYEPQDLRD